MAVDIKIPSVGESITEVEIGDWLKSEGDAVEKDENVVALETEKATVEVPSPSAGTLAKIMKKKGETAKVGETIGRVEEGKPKKEEAKEAPKEKKPAKTEKKEKPTEEAPEPAAETSPDPKKEPSPKKLAAEEHEETEAPAESIESKPRVMPAAQRALDEHGVKAEQVKATGPGGRLLKEDVRRHVETTAEKEESKKPEPAPRPAETAKLVERKEEVVRMSPLRRTIARRLVEAQRTAALLTTFNEIDMTSVIVLRKEHGEAFQKKYNIKLGFMSFFVKAAIDALKQIPALNAEVKEENIVYRNYCDIGIAVSIEKGLVVPVLRNVERMSFAEIEIAIADFARRAQENKLKPEELQGGTFTISNGGVFGSLLSTPIINPPQSGVLGMHAIQERPVAREGQVVIRPMMYVALTYDHRIVDGREAVTFLKRIKECVENPSRMLMEV